MTLIELMLVMSVLVGALVVLSQSLTAAMRLTDVNRETALATDAIRTTIEILDGAEDFGTVFALYNDDPDDDPGVPGSAPGPAFAVNGLSPQLDDPDGLVGEILFPAVPGVDGLDLLEDLDLPELGMPRDLDGSGDVDGADHSDDYQLLPALVRLRWTGVNGPREMQVLTLLADR